MPTFPIVPEVSHTKNPTSIFQVRYANAPYPDEVDWPMVAQRAIDKIQKAHGGMG
jgi:hypothetical protein